jgi:hypothetical protein
MVTIKSVTFTAITITLMHSAAIAADKTEKVEARPAVFEELVNCRAIENPDTRLICYDNKVAAIDTAEKNKDLILSDKASIKEARRGLFGFSLPKIKIFGDKAEDEIAEINATIVSAYQDRNGNWIIVLDDDAKWQQIDSGQLALNPKSGMKVRIRKAALGSYFVNVAGQPGIKMKRVN